jgi:hypothetical protein
MRLREQLEKAERGHDLIASEFFRQRSGSFADGGDSLDTGPDPLEEEDVERDGSPGVSLATGAESGARRGIPIGTSAAQMLILRRRRQRPEWINSAPTVQQRAAQTPQSTRSDGFSASSPSSPRGELADSPHMHSDTPPQHGDTGADLNETDKQVPNSPQMQPQSPRVRRPDTLTNLLKLQPVTENIEDVPQLAGWPPQSPAALSSGSGADPPHLELHTEGHLSPSHLAQETLVEVQSRLTDVRRELYLKDMILERERLDARRLRARAESTSGVLATQQTEIESLRRQILTLQHECERLSRTRAPSPMRTSGRQRDLHSLDPAAHLSAPDRHISAHSPGSDVETPRGERTPRDSRPRASQATASSGRRSSLSQASQASQVIEEKGRSLFDSASDAIPSGSASSERGRARGAPLPMPEARAGPSALPSDYLEFERSIHVKPNARDGSSPRRTSIRLDSSIEQPRRKFDVGVQVRTEGKTGVPRTRATQVQETDFVKVVTARQRLNALLTGAPVSYERTELAKMALPRRRRLHSAPARADRPSTDERAPAEHRSALTTSDEVVMRAFSTKSTQCNLPASVTSLRTQASRLRPQQPHLQGHRIVPAVAALLSTPAARPSLPSPAASIAQSGRGTQSQHHGDATLSQQSQQKESMVDVIPLISIEPSSPRELPFDVRTSIQVIQRISHTPSVPIADPISLGVGPAGTVRTHGDTVQVVFVISLNDSGTNDARSSSLPRSSTFGSGLDQLSLQAYSTKGRHGSTLSLDRIAHEDTASTPSARAYRQPLQARAPVLGGQARRYYEEFHAHSRRLAEVAARYSHLPPRSQRWMHKIIRYAILVLRKDSSYRQPNL